MFALIQIQMNGISSYTELMIRKRANDQIDQEIRRRQNPVEYVAKPPEIVEMQGYHRLAPLASIGEIDRRMPVISKWTPQQIIDFSAYVLSLPEGPPLASLRGRMLRIAMHHIHIDNIEVLHSMACAAFHTMASSLEEPPGGFSAIRGMPKKDIAVYSMTDIHAGILAVQMDWHTVDFTETLHNEIVRFLEHMANITVFEFDPPNELCNHPGWMRNGKPSDQFTMMCISFLSDYLNARTAAGAFQYADVDVALTADEEANAWRWLVAAMADPDVIHFFQKHFDEWVAAPGLFGMYRMTVPRFPYLKISTRTVKKSTCIHKVFSGINLLIKTPASQWAEQMASDDPRWPMCADSAFFCALSTVLPSKSNVQIREKIDIYDFFSPRRPADVTRVGGVFYFHTKRARVCGLLPALKYWLPTLFNGQQLCDDIFRDGLYRTVSTV